MAKNLDYRQKPLIKVTKSMTNGKKWQWLKPQWQVLSH